MKCVYLPWGKKIDFFWGGGIIYVCYSWSLPFCFVIRLSNIGGEKVIRSKISVCVIREGIDEHSRMVSTSDFFFKKLIYYITQCLMFYIFLASVILEQGNFGTC